MEVDKWAGEQKGIQNMCYIKIELELYKYHSLYYATFSIYLNLKYLVTGNNNY